MAGALRGTWRKPRTRLVHSAAEDHSAAQAHALRRSPATSAGAACRTACGCRVPAACCVPCSSGAEATSAAHRARACAPRAGVKAMQSQSSSHGSSERFRLAMSDGQVWMSGMLATQLNELVRTNQVGPGVIVKVEEFITNELQNKKRAPRTCCPLARSSSVPA